jgi:FixJ family two-component response regulator
MSTFTAPIVFVVDDDISVRESLELLIESSGWQAETFASAQEFLAHSETFAPSCLILDVTLPDLSGLDLQKRIAAARPAMPVIVITGYADVAMSVRAMKAGATEFLTKPFSEDVLVEAIRQALERSRRALEHVATVNALRDNYALLTQRERQVMGLVVSGLLNKQVGGELGISEITVKAHRGQVMRKMKADSLPALVHMVAALGLPIAAMGSAIGSLAHFPLAIHSR